MKILLVFLLAALLAPRTLSSAQNPLTLEQSAWSARVASVPGHQEMASFCLPLSKPFVLGANSAPNCGIYVAQIAERWTDSRVSPRTARGELVSGFRFNGWMENGKAKVMVWALVNTVSSTHDSIDEKDLTGELVDTFLIEPGATKIINELLQYGTKPIEISVARSK